MKWVATRTPSGQFAGLGLIEGEEIRVLDASTRLPELLARRDGLARAAESARNNPCAVRSLAATPLGAPIHRPPSIRDFSAFESHIVTVAKGIGFPVPPEWYELPGFYFSNPAAVIGPEDEVTIPAGSRMLDYELEVGLVIGHHGPQQLSAAPLEAVAGMVIMNDWSARDIQRRERALGLGPVKSKDFATTLGPWFVTLDELAPYRTSRSFDLQMIARVNGVEYSRASLADIHYSLDTLVRYAARDTTLAPGDILGTGTCGTGCILEQSLAHGGAKYPWLEPGDVVELEVAQLGILRNRIVESRCNPDAA
jgi:2-keto-4-pentenoate hydratase/2-oxohepta-3-ene-1,7-dioic acid hydratase in catechol pathway